MPIANALRVVLAFPSNYSVGITSLGYQVIWATLAEREDIDVRRLFTDQEDKLPQNPDLFGLSLSWELDGPILLNLLEKKHIPLWSYERQNLDPIVFGGGPVLTANPEPFAPFFDVILIGDGEELLPNFIDKFQQVRDLPRFQKLLSLAEVPGVYIPSLYTPKYSSDGNLLAVEPNQAGVPKTISKQTWTGQRLSHSKVVTPDAVWPDIYMVELVRSCPELCRFCLASYLTVPFRKAPIETELIPLIELGIKHTNRIGLLGASVTQHPDFTELLRWLSKDIFQDMHLSISSVRAATITKEMVQILNSRGCKSLTIAIESGSEKIRKLVNKKLSEEEILDAARYVEEGGLKGLKLYGMVGLPLEEEQDVNETAELLIRIKNQNPRLRITLGASTFVPKAHTPFQFYGVRPESKHLLNKLAKKIKPKGISFRPESYGWSIIQSLLSRSDRRLAPIIAIIKDQQNTLGTWKKVYKEVRSQGHFKIGNQDLPMPPAWEDIVHETWDSSRIMPWTHIEGPLKYERLVKDLEISLKQFSNVV